MFIQPKLQESIKNSSENKIHLKLHQMPQLEFLQEEMQAIMIYTHQKLSITQSLKCFHQFNTRSNIQSLDNNKFLNLTNMNIHHPLPEELETKQVKL